MLLDLYPYRASAHSGVMRLQLYKLQEEALIKRAAKEAAEKVMKKEESVVVEPVQVKITPKLEPLVELETYDVPSFKRKAIYSRPTPLMQPGVWQSVVAVSLEIDAWLSVHIPRWEERKAELTKKQAEAANDADFRLRILLLAA